MATKGAIFVRRSGGPARVKAGEATFLVNHITYATRLRVRSEVRKACGGLVDPEKVEAALAREAIAGWENLHDSGDGSEIVFGPLCPACGAPEAPRGAEAAGGPGGPAIAANASQTPDRPASGVPTACPDCGGAGGAREWAIRALPDAMWGPIMDEAFRVLAREEEVSGN